MKISWIQFRIFFIFAHALFCFSIWGQSVILRAASTPSSEFKSYVQTESVKAYAQFLLEENQNQDMDHLSNLLDQAQEAFLKGHLKTAGEYFQSIANMAYEKDWKEEARKLIFYSLFRLAHIEWQGDTPEVFLHKALLFAPDMLPDTTLFPPPIIEKFNEIKKSSPRSSLRLRSIFPYHEIILINGKIYSPEDQPLLPYGSYRITALSSSHESWNQTILLSQIFNKKIVTKTLVRGHCQAPVISKKLLHHPVLFPGFCLWKNSKKLSRLRNSSKNQNISTQNILKNTHLDFRDQKESYIKNNAWIFIGLGVAVVGAVTFLYARQDSGEDSKKSSPIQERKPTIKIGF